MFNAKMFAMRDARLFSSLKRTLQIYGDVGVARLLPVASAMHLLPEHRNVHTTSIRSTLPAVESMRPMGLFERFCNKTGLLDIQKYRHMALAYMVYENVMSQVDFPFFYKHFNMPDTYFSWFLVMELHVWMIMTRYMAEGKRGKFIRNHVVAAMWEDADARILNLGPTIPGKIKRKQVIELAQQFNAAIIGYDEGIQCDDRTLAGALWRRIFTLECNNPEHIETLVIYVRKQICLFDDLPSHEILKKPVFKLIDIKSLCKHH
ncbi:ubiquinol-cytochrome-c reductase complex assembly factor 1 isoform X1 [Ooceraea biroi]|uniref:ubiquinol-cytochrome-c reductase complex assembly factor 1 isoform X1 n=1 Tax=Ooceraea biroi TaxID=2015173 RepID=UPI0005BD4EDB|nr:ubiquinol-cytochrome-c reductase complex assembly factor 1 isoform X1 [Ooceraea biroi]